MGNLGLRLLTAAVLAPLAILAVWAGGWALAAGIALISALAVGEWLALVGRPTPWTLAAGGVLAAAVVVAAFRFGPAPGLVAMLAAAAVLCLLPAPGGSRLMAGAGIVYACLAAISLLWLRAVPGDGLGLAVWVLLVVWATDTGGFAAGRTIGGPRLAPTISPKKTWSGLAGAVLLAALAGWAAATAFGAARPVALAGAAGVLGLVAQAGDLFESALKRHAGVKDSGRLIPGHGGILDRIDGLMTAAPAFALVHALMGERLAWW
jgi:phosphatidate cytidylyltransferase